MKTALAKTLRASPLFKPHAHVGAVQRFAASPGRTASVRCLASLRSAIATPFWRGLLPSLRSMIDAVTVLCLIDEARRRMSSQWVGTCLIFKVPPIMAFSPEHSLTSLGMYNFASPRSRMRRAKRNPNICISANTWSVKPVVSVKCSQIRLSDS